MGTTVTRMTIDEFLALPEKEGYKRELIDGEIFEMSNAGPRHEIVKSNFALELGLHFRSNKLRGRVFSESMYRLARHYAPIPDVSIVLSGELDPDHTGEITVVPDIAIEVVSSESATDLQRKVKLYLDRGVSEVWVAYPELSFIDVYTKEGSRRLAAGQNLDAPALLPGFSIPVTALFEGL